MHCGFIPAAQHVDGMRWEPETFKLETCAGYTTTLPDVLDVAMSFAHWETGQLALMCDGEQPPRALLDGIAVLKDSVSELEAWHHRDKEGGK